MKLIGGLKGASRKGSMTQALPEQPKSNQIAAPAARPSGNNRKTVTIEAKIDVGFGNLLYLRGQGRGLSWDRGIPLTCVDGSTWKWSTEAEDQLKFKLLLNDTVWAQGEDLVAAPGQKVQVSPAF